MKTRDNAQAVRNKPNPTIAHSPRKDSSADIHGDKGMKRRRFRMPKYRNSAQMMW